jgi:Fe-S cluster assembly ATP-binding protein
MAILEIRNLRLQLDGQKILDNVNIEFWEGHVHAVIGPNGAGKSTLASTIMGLDGYQGYDGDILFNGQSIRGKSVDERARLGITLAWQEPARFEGLSVRDFILCGAREKSGDVVEKVLTDVGLETDRYVTRAVDRTLSGGERKKVELAGILAMRPPIAMLDEPDSGIDIESITRIFEAVYLLKEGGTTVILITHSLAVLERAEHAFLMCNGRVVNKGTVDKIRPYFENKCIPCDHKNFYLLNDIRAGEQQA